MSLLDDFLSGDPTRIWSASGAVRHLRDPVELAQLAESVDLIEERSRGDALGGMMRPNTSHLEFACRKLRFFASSNECLCALYSQDDLYDPDREAKAGSVVVEGENLAEWSSVCRCTACAAIWDVEARQYHYMWWAWKRRP